MKFEVERARELFADGARPRARVPRGVAVDVDLFVRGGLAILDAIEARGFDVLSARPSLSRSTKLRLIAAAAAVQGMNVHGTDVVANAARGWAGAAGARCTGSSIARSRSVTDVSLAMAEDSR